MQTSDAGSHGHEFFFELELMEKTGMPPLAVLNATTGVSAALRLF